MKRQIPIILLLFCIFILSASAQTKPKFVCDSELPNTEHDFKEWAGSSVKWIITYAEERAFIKLRSNEDKIQFIENFWRRRDPDPDTEENEFRLEYCKRIQEAEKFQSGVPGWKTDRGRVCVLFGKPSNVQKGRNDFEDLKSILFEKWTYDLIDGFAGDIQMTFIDPTESNEYRFTSADHERMTKLFENGKRGLSVTIGPN